MMVNQPVIIKIYYYVRRYLPHNLFRNSQRDIDIGMIREDQCTRRHFYTAALGIHWHFQNNFYLRKRVRTKNSHPGSGLTLKSFRAIAVVVIHEINTCGTILTFIYAVIDIFVARDSSPSQLAYASKSTIEIFTFVGIYARTKCRRWITFTFVHIYEINVVDPKALLSQNYLPKWQNSPVHSFGHSHLNPPIRSIHVPRAHGRVAHSFISEYVQKR